MKMSTPSPSTNSTSLVVRAHQFASAKRPGPADEEEGTVAKSGKRKAFSGSAVGAGAAGQVLNNGPKVFDH